MTNFTIPDLSTHAAENAEASFTFIALKAANVRLCSYTAVTYNSTRKYDQFFCNTTRGTIIPIQGIISTEMTKRVSSATVLQGATLDYTIQYTNTGSLPLSYVWIWDDVNPLIGSVILSSISPAYDVDATNSHRVAWYLGTVPAAGQPGSKGTLAFSILIDGNGQELADGTSLVNLASFGINSGSLPSSTALTSSTTTTVQAPTTSIQKSDGLVKVEDGDFLTYTIDIANSGSVTATGLIITDVLPLELSLVGNPIPAPDIMGGQSLVWNSLGSLAGSGGALTIKIPVKVGMKIPDGTILTNQAAFQYRNSAQYLYAPRLAADQTGVAGPILSVTKSGTPNPVLTGRDITYSLAYRNSGPAEATNSIISDTVPLDTAYKSCSGGISCSKVGQVVTWQLGSLPAGASGSVSLVVTTNTGLSTGTLIYNSDYGIQSDQTNFSAGPQVTTSVNRDAALFKGIAFVDADGDGVFDPGEGTLTGIHINLPGANEPDQYTDAQGKFGFRVETAGPVSVTAGDWPDYFHTTQAVVNLNAVLGITQTVNFGYAPTSSPFGVIFGTVFSDRNHDGVQNNGELGLAGVSVASTSAASSPVSTGDFGQYTLRFNTAGAVTLNETNLTGYVSTTPDSIATTVSLGSSGASPLDFGDFLGIKITGQVFDDENVNGVKDIGEGGITGAVLSAAGEIFTTGVSGEYTLFVELTGSDPVQIAETDPSGYISTGAVPGGGMSRLDANTLAINAPVSGNIYAGGDFGDTAAVGVVTIQGQVWDDNGAGGGGLANGIKDGTEPGLAGAVVSLSSGFSQVSAADGTFTLYAPHDQVVTLHEENSSGYVSTNAIPGAYAHKVNNDLITVDALAAGSTSSGNLFGDVLSGTSALLTGAVFDDQNENGVLDSGEPGISGVKVSLEIALGNIIEVTTNSEGNYQFAVEPGKEISLVSSGPGGSFHPTTPERVTIQVPAPGVYLAYNFGYSDNPGTSVIYGIVFDDVNSNGLMDLGEQGLAGATISLDDSETVTTGNVGLVTGTFSFQVPTPATAPAVHIVKRVNPAGYRSTTPDLINVSVGTSPASYYVEFGSTNSTNIGSIYGIVFDDLNSNGIQDVNEFGLAGVVVSATLGGESGIISTVTRAYGQYTYGFEFSEAGYHTISEQDPARPGYHSTTPDSVSVLVELGTSHTVNFGDTAMGFIVMGTVFNDLNGDGNQDPAETGLKDVMVSLSDGSSTTTSDFGTYSIPIANPGADPELIHVIENNPSGFHSTTPDDVTVEITQNQQVYQVNFGDSNNPFVTSIYGFVFQDQNVNSAYDYEPGVPGVTVMLRNEGVHEYLTNEWGQFTFQVEATGWYTLTEIDLPGWESTIAIPGPAGTRLDNNTLREQVGSLGGGFDGGLFGDVRAADVVSVEGVVWDDNGAGAGGVRADGLRNGAEPGLAGAVVSLSSGMVSTTASDGAFHLFGPPEETLILHETNPAGFLSTAAIPGTDASKVDDDTLKINPLSGGLTSTGSLFGDVNNNTAATIIGTVYEDANGNGQQDAGELGIPGVTVSLDGLYNTTTSSSGSYQFITPVAGVHTVVETDLSGYFSTTPNQVQLNVSMGGSYVVDFGDAQKSAGFASINGTVYEDANGNGQQDAGEPGISGVTVSLDGVSTTSTGFNGYYQFITPVAGVHTVEETDLSGYFSTTPNQVHLNVSLGGSYVVDFGDAQTSAGFASINGTVYEDANGNGQQDAGELGIPGVTVSLDGTSTATTGQYGGYSLSTEVTGVHTVEETDLSGYFSTTPNQVQLNVSLGGSYVVDFGDAQTSAGFASINGTVYEDANGNGHQDAGEPGIPSVTVSLDGTSTATTGQYGGYSLSTEVTGVHTVEETDLSGYFSTTPNQVQLNVSLGGSYVVDFGDAQTSAGFASINGTVYEDANGNGQQDAGEPGISGVTVSLDGVSTTSTGFNGYYQFITPVAGVHTVVETDLSGYFSTTPNQVQLNVSLGGSYVVDFGDAQTSAGFASINGTVYEDANGNGQQDAGELGIPGVTVSLDGNATTITQQYGTYSFATTSPGLHTVTETDLVTYISTTPNIVQTDVALGNSYQVDFGDKRTCQCTNDASEEDDTFENAKPIQLGRINLHACNFCDDAVDWLSFTAQAMQTYTVTTWADGQRADTILELYATDGTTMIASNDNSAGTTDFSSALVWEAPSTGVFYLKVTNRGQLIGCNTEYSVWIEGTGYYFAYLPAILNSLPEVSPSGSRPQMLYAVPANELFAPLGVINHMCPDTYEIDDTWQSAVPIVSGIPQIHSFDSNPAIYAADKDLVSFAAFTGDTVTFTTQLTNTQVLLELYDANGYALDVSGVNQLSWNVTKPATYFLSLSPLSGDYGCSDVAGYSLTLDFQPIPKVYLPMIMR